VLADTWDVETAVDGLDAVARARARPPDLILADVMMPRLDGFGLLRAIRSDRALAPIPVVLVTARAGEEAAIDGLLAGADDYVVKPFSARELVARVGGQIELARVRRHGEDRFRALIHASWDVVYRMSPDWTEMRALDGRGFIADTDSRARAGSASTSIPTTKPGSPRRSSTPSPTSRCSSSSTGYAGPTAASAGRSLARSRCSTTPARSPSGWAPPSTSPSDATARTPAASPPGDHRARGCASMLSDAWPRC
jgi:CheY-like chemotaxis protein